MARKPYVLLLSVGCWSLSAVIALGACSDPEPIDNTVKSISMLASQAGTPPAYLGWSGIDPNAVIVFVGGADLACDQPFLQDWHTGNECSGPDRREWRLAIVLPPGTAPGSVDLSNVQSGDNQQWVDDDACAGGGGQLSGTAEVVSIDTKTVALKLDGATIGKVADMPDVQSLVTADTITAIRCP